MRLFFALWPEGAERRRLALLAAGCPAPWRPLPDADLHLTIAFLGELPRARLPWLAAVLGRHRDPAPPVVLDRLEAWGEGRWRCAVGDATPRLRAWQRRLAARLSAGGLRAERRAFVPHVTLAKGGLPRRAPGPALPDRPLAGGEPLRPAVRLAAAGLVLVESRALGRTGTRAVARYRVLLQPGQAGRPLRIGAKRALFRAGAGEDMY